MDTSPMRVHCLGSCQEVGRSCFLVETDQRTLFDYGLKIYSRQNPKKQNLMPLPYQGDIDAMVLSHAHLDHSGCIPELYTRPPVHWFGTPPTMEIASLLWADSLKIMGEDSPYQEMHVNRAENRYAPLLYEQVLSLGDTDYSLHDAGHILGSAMVKAKHNGKTLLYSGDFKMGDTRMHKGAVPPEEADYLILESTYSNREHPNREELEKKLISTIEETIDLGGTVLLPAFAVGRSQELLSVLHSRLRGIPVFLDGMSKAVTNIYLNNDDYIRDPKSFREAAQETIFADSIRDKKDATAEPSIIVSTAGMMEGGPALRYLQHLNPASRLIFTGYNVEGTNGWRILNQSKALVDGYELEVSVPADYLDFSAHVGHSGLVDFVKKVNPEKIILNHGDDTPGFAQELAGMGFDAVAPKNGDTIDL
ncbi:MBL fold metallo-hydrolase [Candidatus Micrarchaeota archaeon]|nr:MBL fold metallo-hydrolase [Candidatus Micrarchaeota archaeon]MBD3417715.1 MBL fold metallo-hydrolase [Candidatus Micrarchaeota archaeon]